MKVATNHEEAIFCVLRGKNKTRKTKSMARISHLWRLIRATRHVVLCIEIVVLLVPNCRVVRSNSRVVTLKFSCFVFQIVVLWVQIVVF